VNVIVVQAQAGPHLVGDPQRVIGVFRAIESSGRDALVELRRLLGILRSEDEQLAIGPQPGLGSLQSLVEQMRASGLPVQLRIEGEPVHLLADDQELVRTGFRVVLDAEPDLEVVGEAADGFAALDATETLRPDIVLMDIRMPNLDGIEATRRIAAGDGSPRILILTTFDLD